MLNTMRCTLRRRRSVTVVGLVLATLAGLLTIGAGVAQAGNLNCRDWRDVPWTYVPEKSSDSISTYEYYIYTLTSSTPVFNIADTRISTNNLETPTSVTFTSQQSKTYSVSVTASMGASFFGFLSANVSVNVTQSRTTSVGVSTTATVPSHRTVRGDYGVHAYNVVTDVRVIQRQLYWNGPGPAEGCGDYYEHRTDNVPTTLEGWQVSLV